MIRSNNSLPFKSSTMSLLHVYLAATVCILGQLVAGEHSCKNAQRPLSFSVVSKRNATCHWVAEVQMDEGADDPLLNGGWHVLVSPSKESTRGLGQVVEVTANKIFNEITEQRLCSSTKTPAKIPCQTTDSSILSLINASEKPIASKDQTTTVGGAIGVDTFAMHDANRMSSPEVATTKKMDILIPSPTLRLPKSTSTKAPTTTEAPTTYFKPSEAPITPIMASTTTAKATLEASSSTYTKAPTTKKPDILFTPTTSTASIPSGTLTLYNNPSATPTEASNTGANKSSTTAEHVFTTQKSDMLFNPLASTTVALTTITKASAHTEAPFTPSEAPTRTIASTTNLGAIDLGTYPDLTAKDTDGNTEAKGSEGSTEKPTSVSGVLVEKGNDKIESSDVFDEGDDFDKIEDLDIDVRLGLNSENGRDKEKDYDYDNTLDLGVKVE